MEYWKQLPDYLHMVCFGGRDHFPAGALSPVYCGNLGRVGGKRGQVSASDNVGRFLCSEYVSMPAFLTPGVIR